MNKILIVIVVLIFVAFGIFFLMSYRGTNDIIENTVINDDSVESGQVIEGLPPVIEEVISDDTTEETVEEFALVASNFEYDIKEIRVKKGTKVKISLTVSEGFHDFVIDEFSGRIQRIGSGEDSSTEFVASEIGEYEYYCSVGNHRELGMVGKLIIE